MQASSGVSGAARSSVAPCARRIAFVSSKQRLSRIAKKAARTSLMHSSQGVHRDLKSSIAGGLVDICSVDKRINHHLVNLALKSGESTGCSEMVEGLMLIFLKSCNWNSQIDEQRCWIFNARRRCPSVADHGTFNR